MLASASPDPRQKVNFAVRLNGFEQRVIVDFAVDGHCRPAYSRVPTGGQRRTVDLRHERQQVDATLEVPGMLDNQVRHRPRRRIEPIKALINVLNIYLGIGIIKHWLQVVHNAEEPMAADLSRIKGSFPPLVTPLRAGDVDLDAYERLVDFQIENGSHGILVNGTTAEPSTLTLAERNQLVDVAMKAARGRVPVIAATGSQSLAETEILTDHAVAAGADALLIVTPYYIRPPQRGLVRYYLELASRHETPWMIYHIPGRTAVSLTIDSLEQIRAASPHFFGMKHAVNDLAFVSQCLSALGEDFRIFVGLEDLSLPMMSVGACGLMNAVGNLQPSVLAQLCEAVWKNDLKVARGLHQRLFEINQAVFFDTNPIPMKYMMKRLGILTNNEHRLPMMPATADLERRLDIVLERAGLLS